MKAILCYSLLWILLLSVESFTQIQSEEKLEIVNADTMNNSRTPRGSLLELIGNVHFRQGTSEMFCGRAEYWKDTHETIIEQNVRIYDRRKLLIADRVYYYDVPQIFKAMGHVLLRDSLQQITAQQVSYFKLEDRVIAEKSVAIKDSLNYIDIVGERAEFDNVKNYAIITDGPVFTKKDSTGREEIRITSLQMELFESGDRAIATDSVRIIQNKANATCGLAEFHRKKSEIFLKQQPVVWQGGDRLSGELIHLFIKKNQLIKAIVRDQATVTSQVDTTGTDQRLNILTGQQITMYFENEELFQVVVENKATSDYHIIEENEEKGSNRIIGDKITVYLKDRKIEGIVVESNPQLSSGTYYPPGKMTEREKM